ncbi:hypothetical protein GGR56DRAFT_616594 [Xylariaceae sp. FL0804]|nr:hypothetical protein GGR56DRAFT_616594 [Xylariaceae sp. FL0804]
MRVPQYINPSPDLSHLLRNATGQPQLLDPEITLLVSPKLDSQDPDKMRPFIAPLAALLLTSSPLVSAARVDRRAMAVDDDVCGTGCSAQSECSGTCFFCSTPAEGPWVCTDGTIYP